MKKMLKVGIVLAILLFPFKVYADEAPISFRIECPQTAALGSKIECALSSVISDTSTFEGLQGDLEYTSGLTNASFTKIVEAQGNMTNDILVIYDFEMTGTTQIGKFLFDVGTDHLMLGTQSVSLSNIITQVSGGSAYQGLLAEDSLEVVETTEASNNEETNENPKTAVKTEIIVLFTLILIGTCGLVYYKNKKLSI